MELLFLRRLFVKFHCLSRVIYQFAVVMCLVLGSAGCTDNQKKTNSSLESAKPVLKFTAIPDQNTTELAEKFGVTDFNPADTPAFSYTNCNRC